MQFPNFNLAMNCVEDIATENGSEMAIEEDLDPPPWVLPLMKYSEDLVLKSALGSPGNVAKWLPNGRAAISQDGSTCVAVVD